MIRISAPALDDPLPFCLNFLIVLICGMGEEFFLDYYGAWWTVLIIFVILPVLDSAVAFEDLNPASTDEVERLGAIQSFRYITWVWAPIQLGLIVSSLDTAGTAWAAGELSTFLGVLSSTGIGTGAIGITIAHELIHKNSAFESGLGKLILACCCYGHWHAAHLLGHHKLIGTEADPSTAQRGESFWRFLWRNTVSEFPLAVALEQKRLQNKQVGFFSPENSILSIWALSLLIVAFVYTCFGPVGVAFFLLQSAIAISLLAAVNYIEHYGLSRSPGEPISGHHSWNSRLTLSNFSLYKLQRHGDHHLHGKRRYQALSSMPDTPQHPWGYPVMILLALVPPFWFRVMDPLISQLSFKNESSASPSSSRFKS
ncbi:MAG: alkane 1-monooxygenase, partial [archaeon]|nr:alkane 1-monooxygenase [archaeon]